MNKNNLKQTNKSKKQSEANVTSSTNEYDTNGYSNGFLNDFSNAGKPNITISASDADATSKAKGQSDNEYDTNGYSNGFLNDFSNADKSNITSSATYSEETKASKVRSTVNKDTAKR